MEQGQKNAAMATPEKVVVAEPVRPKNNKNKVGMIVGIVCLVILAVAGLSFGAYAMITKDNAVADAVASCAANKPTDTPQNMPEDELEVQEITCSDGTTVEVEVPSIANPSEYIIIGEFGMKIKKPSNWLALISKYAYYNDFPHAAPTFEVVDIEGDSAYIAQIGTDCKSATLGYSVCFNIGDTYYIVSEMPSPSEMTEADGLTETYEAFYNFVTNPDNYSKI